MNKAEPSLIGIHGGKRTGKDTLGRHLTERRGYTRVAFADKVRELLLYLNPSVLVDYRSPQPVRDVVKYLTHPYLDLRTIVREFGWEVAKEVPAVREYLQSLGTGAREFLHEEIWIDAADKEISRILFKGGKVVVTDIRHENEAKYIWTKGGETIRVVRDAAPKGDTHLTEQPIDDGLIDHEIPNNGSVDELKARADSIVGFHPMC